MNGQSVRSSEADVESSRLRILMIITTIILIGTVMMIGFHYFFGAPIKSVPGQPVVRQASFLFNPGDRFMDFYNDYNRAVDFRARASQVIDYTPWAHLIVSALTVFPSKVALFLEFCVFAGTIVFMLMRYFVTHAHGRLLKIQQFFILAALSYPVLFVVDRGNHEMLVFVFLFWFLHLYYTKQSPWAGVFLAAAIAMKMYPGTLLILLIADRKFRDVAITVVSVLLMLLVGTAGLSLLSGYGFEQVVAFSMTTLFGGHEGWAMSGGGVQHGHSLWGASMHLAATWGMPVPVFATFNGVYAKICLGIFLLASVYVVFFERRAWARVAILVFCATALPFVSADYTLIHVFLPLMVFMHTRDRRYDTVITVLFALLLVPMDFMYVSDVSTSVIIYPVLMMAIVVVIGMSRRGMAMSDSNSLNT